MISDEKIQDFIDDRLSPRDRIAVCLALVDDPELARRVQELWLVDGILRGTGAPILDEPVPKRLTSILHEAMASLDD